MARFEITGPDGARYEVTAPDEASALAAFNSMFESPPQETAPSAPRHGMADSAALGALDSVTFGLADEIGSGFDWVADKILPGGQGRSYSDILALNRGVQREAQADNPGSYIAGQIGGGVGTGVGAVRAGLSLGARAAQQGGGLGRIALGSAADGAGFGAAYGAGSASENRAESAGTGAIVGGLLGGAAPYAVAGATAVAQPFIAPLASRLRPQAYADRALAEGLERSGMTADQVAGSLVAAQADGQGMFTAADALGHAGGRMLSTVARTPNNARQGVVDALEARQIGQSERLSSALAEGFAAPDTAAQRTAALTANRSATANTNYAAAREGAGMIDPTRAIQTADLFLQPGSTRVMSPQSNIADDSVEAAVRRARGYLTDGRSVLTDFNAAQRAKIEIDAMIEGARPAVQRHLIPIRNALDEALSAASPGYAQARDTFARQSRQIDAVETGRNAASSRMRADDTIPAFRGMSADEQSAFRAGYVDPIIGRIEAASLSPTTNRARQLLTDKTRQEFPEFAAAGQGNRLQARIGREQRMFETANAALGGSKTADNLADAAEMARFDPGVLTALFQGRPVQAAVSAVTRLLSESRGLPPRVVETIATTLMETRPDVVRALLSSASQARSSNDQTRRVANTILTALSAGGAGRAVSQ